MEGDQKRLNFGKDTKQTKKLKIEAQVSRSIIGTHRKSLKEPQKTFKHSKGAQKKRQIKI